MKNALHDSIQAAIQKGWADLSSSFGNMEGEIKKRFRKARRYASPQQTSEDVQALLTDLGERLQNSSQQAEKKFEDSMRTMSSVVKRPMEDLASLKERAEKLGTRIESQIRRRSQGEEADEDTARDE